MLEEEQKEQDEGDEEEEWERAHLQLSHNSPQLKFAVCHAPLVAEGHNSYLLLVLFRRWETAEKLISKSIHYMMPWLPPSARETRGKFEENCLLLSVVVGENAVAPIRLKHLCAGTF